MYGESGGKSSGGSPVPPVELHNVAEGGKVFASGFESPFLPGLAIDGNSETRWSSDFVDGCWLSIDLRKLYGQIRRIELEFETASAEDYTLLSSIDGENWETLASVTGGNFGNHDVATHTFDALSARYVKFVCDKRKMQYGCSLYEIRVMASDEGVVTPDAYKYLLNSMPPTLRQSLVCWFDPKYQGLTNDDLMDNYPRYIGGLVDLSGNGHDITLCNMDGEDGGHVTEDGFLVFDGNDDYGFRDEILGTYNYTVFADIDNIGKHHQHSSVYSIVSSGNAGILYWRCDTSSDTIVNTKYIDGYPVPAADKHHIMRNGINEVDTEGLSANLQAKAQVIADARVGVNFLAGFKLKTIIRFDRLLQDSEKQWIIDNILNHQ